MPTNSDYRAVTHVRSHLDARFSLCVPYRRWVEPYAGCSRKQGYVKTLWGIARPDDHHNKTIELMLRASEQIVHALGVHRRRVWRGFRMGVPIADEVKAACVPLKNFCLLAPAVRPEAKTASNIVMSGRRRLRNDDMVALKPGEELSAGLALPPPALTVFGKPAENRLG